ncbi:TetR/AcrR family transcriptional regulator [Anaeroselena agilis]|uniref:TetR/AcrR family transcriptional regulator n=1 Tax=Anaeroselena agilis TaxID=3063788 RepID=A0ABU3NUT0_9FIRM|nr:TetR/AcrR family transcriptional regulator [Selenomonadales bacterium 4137-cl]
MDNIKELILDKARERFDRFGYKKTTMDEISHDCRVSKKTLYEHFRDKEDLFNRLYVRECRAARDTIFARMGEVADPLDRLVRLLRTAIGYFNEDNFLTRLLRDDYALFTACFTSEHQRLIDDELVAIIAGVIDEGKQKGSIRDVDGEIVAYAGLKLFQAFSYMRTTRFSAEKEEQDYYTGVLVDFIVHAVAGRQAG